MILAKMEWRNLRKGLLIWTLIFVLITLGFSAIYPQMFTPALKEVMTQMMTSLPEGLLATFNISLSGPANMLLPVGFFAYFFQYLFLAACTYAILMGTQSLIGEESAGTIDFLYAQPVSRRQIVASKFLTQVFILTIFWLCAALASLGGLLLFKTTGDSTKEIFDGILKIFLNEWVILLFFLTLGFFLSTLLKSANQGTGIALSFVFGFYLLGVVANLYDKVAFLADFSPVKLGIPASILNQGLPQIGWILFASLLLMVGTFFFYQRKDLES